MDVLDQLNDRPACGLCNRLIPYSDDFCSECRRIAKGTTSIVGLEQIGLDPVSEAELITLVAS